LRRSSVIVAAVRDAAGGAQSTFEIDFARLCRRAGLAEPSRQAVRTNSNGRKRYRDAYFEQRNVHVEIDGSQHMNVNDWYADMRQHNGRSSRASACCGSRDGWFAIARRRSPRSFALRC
jgi:hypothetical protein